MVDSGGAENSNKNIENSTNRRGPFKFGRGSIYRGFTVYAFGPIENKV